MMIRDLLNNKGEEWQKAALRALAKHMNGLAKRTNGFGDGSSRAAAESTTTVGGQP